MRRCYQQENREIQSFLVAVEEAERRNARLRSGRRGQTGRTSDAKEYESDSEDDNGEAEDFNSATDEGSDLITTSCRR